mgnify:CR=1 FL=1
MASFTPIVGTKTEIDATPIVDGQFLLVSDQTKIPYVGYLDVQQGRKGTGLYHWLTLANKPFDYTGNGLTVVNGVLNSTSVDWSNLTNKIFDTIGDGLTVNASGQLNLGSLPWHNIKTKPFETFGSGLSVTDNILNMDNQSWDDIINKPFSSFGTGIIIENGVLKATGAIVGGLSWNNVNDKPFNTIGSGLVVESGVLKANSSLSTVTWGNLVGKPFSTIGNGLLVNGSDELILDTTITYTWGMLNNKPFSTIGNGLDVVNDELVLDIGLDWTDVTSKPFTTVGSGLSIDSLTDTISQDVQSVVLNTTGTASDTNTSYQQLLVNNVEVGEIYGEKYMEITQDISINPIYVFTNSDITTDSCIEVYTNKWGLNYLTVSVNSGTCAVTFAQGTDSENITCRIYIK